MTGFVHSGDLTIRPSGSVAGRHVGQRRPTHDTYADDTGTELDVFDGQRPTPLAWARQRRERKQVRRVDATRERAKGRLNRLGHDWQLIDAATLGAPKTDSFMAIGPGGVFGVTVKTQGRSRVMLSGDTVQIAGRRPDFVGEARRLAAAMSSALSRTAGVKVPVTPVLALAGSGPISVYGAPRGCVVMPHRELDNVLRAYGARIAPRTVAKLASIARHPATAIDIWGDELGPSYIWQSGEATADKPGGHR